MLSRRNIRIKVMQCLYAWEKESFKTVPLAERSLLSSINSSYSLLLYNLYMIRMVGEHALKEMKRRAEKKLPSGDDLNFNISISENKVIKELGQNVVFNDLVKEHKLHLLVNADQVKKLFRDLMEHKEYKKYILLKDPTWEDDSTMVQHLYNKIMLASEIYTQDMEEHFTNWVDDQASINFKMNQLLSEKDFATELNKRSQFMADEEDEEFAAELLRKTIASNDEFDTLIEPKLQNWDIERIAALDMILMKMAMSELMYFNKIPIKVSINEYIDISKIYSTPKSKDFINGVLDKLMNQLKEEGRIKKQGRGLLG